MKKIIAILFMPLIVSAEPGPTTRYLINEPATLLDIGMMRLETLTSEFEKRVGLHWTDNGEMKFFGASIHPTYEQEDDKIYIYISVMDSDPTDEQMAEGCKNAMMQMNIWLLKSMHVLFAHVGYDDQSRPSDFYAGANDLFEIRCHFSSSRDTSQGRFWASRRLGNLGDREMTIGKWKMRNQVFSRRGLE